MRVADRIIDKAQQALGAKSEARLMDAYETRFKDPLSFLRAVRDYDDCRFWKDAGFHSLGHWGHDRRPGSPRSEWTGWAALARNGLVGDDILKLLRTRKLKPEVVAEVHEVLSRVNYRTWIFLCLHFPRHELKATVREWRKLSRSGYRGEAVFIPLWIPEPEYKEIFDGSDPTERPWEVIKRGLLAAGPKPP